MLLRLLLLIVPLTCFGQTENSSVDPYSEYYYSGDTVTFCYEITDWFGGHECMLQSMVVIPGSGWDTIMPIDTPTNCSVTIEGDWVWLDNGWYFSFFPGDWDFTGSCIRSFCVQAVTKESCDELDLDMSVLSSSVCGGNVPYQMYSGYIRMGSECNVGLYIPNTFTPDGDLSNDTIKALGSGIEEFHWTIYDRWNSIVFETHDINEGWSGDNKQNGVYIYRVIYTDITGKTLQIIGHINLIN